MNVVERIKNTAKSRSMTIKDLSLRAGIGPQTIYNWRDRNPQTETLQKVADILNVSVDYLLGNTDEKNPHPAKDEEALTETQQAVATLIDPDVDEDTLKKIEEYIKDQMEVSRARAMKYFEETKDQQKD